jgi:hypothetical protein
LEEFQSALGGSDEADITKQLNLSKLLRKYGPNVVLFQNKVGLKNKGGGRGLGHHNRKQSLNLRAQRFE